MRSTLLRLLASTAYNNGRQAMADYKHSPDPAPLRSTVEQMNKDAETVDGEELLKRAPDMEAMLPYWDKTDDIVAGYDAIVAARDKYLPKFPDEEPQDFNLRLQLTKFTNVYRDIVESLAAKPFEEEITFVESEESSNVPEEIRDFAENVDGAGNNMTVFGSQVMFNGINSAIDWIFVDYPKVDREKVRTRADQKAAGIRPFWSRVLGRNVLEARQKVINGNRELTYIRIFEPGIVEPDRVLVFERSDDGSITWKYYEKVPAGPGELKPKFKVIGEGILSIKRIPMVPFITGRRDGISFKILPAMQDAADLQIKLYQNESALEYIGNLAGYPMLAANGLRPEMGPDNKPKKLARGPSKVLWAMPDGNGNAGSWAYVEPNAQSMEFLEKKCTNIKQDLRELGRQPLTANSGNLTVITTAYAAGKSRSAVSAWALALKDALENALVITAEYMSRSDYEPEVNVYTEFDNFTDGGTDLDALATAREKGDISQETYLNELRRRKVLSPEWTIEQERKRLLEEVPADGKEDMNDDDLPPDDRSDNQQE